MVISALGFASIGPLGKVAYRGGLSVVELQLLRFAAAAPLLMGVGAVRRRGRTGRRHRLAGRTRVRLLALGFIGYGIQATLYFSALSRITASLTSLLLYLYPALVAAVAVSLGRQRLDRATAAGLGLILAGTLLVLGLPAEPADPLGVTLGVMAALWYTAYLLVGERLTEGVDPLVAAAHVAVGATLWFALGLVALRPELGDNRSTAVLAGLAMAVVGTAVPIAALFAGMARVGVTWASIGSALEPVGAVAISVVVLGEGLGAGTVIGGTAVVAGAVVLPLVASRTGRTPATR